MTAEPQSIDAGTDYVVLAKARDIPVAEGLSSGEELWKHVGQYTARSAEAAIRRYMDGGKTEQTTVLVAVPVRSWNPVKVRTKVETSLVIEEA